MGCYAPFHSHSAVLTDFSSEKLHVIYTGFNCKLFFFLARLRILWLRFPYKYFYHKFTGIIARIPPLTLNTSTRTKIHLHDKLAAFHRINFRLVSYAAVRSVCLCRRLLVYKRCFMLSGSLKSKPVAGANVSA